MRGLSIPVGTVGVLILLATLCRSAVGQECVTCKTGRCNGMYWLEACKGKPKRPRPTKAATPATACPGKPTLEVDFPPKVTDGDLLGIRIRSACDVWLIVLYVEDAGGAEVLWPSPEEPEPRAGPTLAASLPSTREVDANKLIQAQLRDRATAASETFEVVALASRADFERLRPRAGEAGGSYVPRLRKEVAALAPDKLAEFRARYTIEPRRAQ